MPIYEYMCDNCGKRFELILLKIPQDKSPPPACPHCGNDDTRRAMSGFALHGEPAADREELGHEKAKAERMASITPKEQIDGWRSHRDKNKK